MLKVDDAVVVLVDVQGKLATLMHNKEQFYANVVRMLKGAQVLDIPIIWNEQLPDKLGETIPEIKEVLADQSPMIKKSFSCWGNPDFVEKLKSLGRKQVLLIGMETHVCVFQTAEDLIDAGFEVHLVADAVSSRFAETKEVGLTAIHDLGAKMTCVEMALLDLLEVAEGDKFRAIIKIIK